MKKLFYTAMVSIFLFILSDPALAAKTPNIKEGLYEVKMRAKMPEIPGMPKELMEKMAKQMPVDTNRQCLTKKDFIPDGEAGDNKRCKFKNKKITGKTVSWSAVCRGEHGASKSEGNIIYQYKSFKGSISVTSEAMDMTTHVTGKYVGKCKK